MDDLDRLLERAGNAGDLEAEALCIVARELRTLSAHMDDVKAAIIGNPRAADEKRIAEAVAAAIGKVPVVVTNVTEKRARKA